MRADDPDFARDFAGVIASGFAGGRAGHQAGSRTDSRADSIPGTTLYTPEQRRRRDASGWTLVQAILAPIQFLIFLVSTILVVRYLATGTGAAAATLSILAKTLALYTIMITGSIWEKAVFGRWLFAAAFFWEDMVSMVVLALHSLYLVALIGGYGTERGRMLIALAAYASYAINATQFLLKLRAARLQSCPPRLAVAA